MIVNIFRLRYILLCGVILLEFFIAGSASRLVCEPAEMTSEEADAFLAECFANDPDFFKEPEPLSMQSAFRGGMSGELAEYCTPKRILSLLQGTEFIQGPLWERTFYPRIRDALYLMPHERMFLECQSGIAFRSFFNKTNEIVYPLVDICSLALNLEEIRSLISMFGGSIAEVSGIGQGAMLDADSILNILPLLEHLSIEGRTSGMQVQMNYKFNRFLLGFESSLLVNERNAFVSERIKEEVFELLMRAIGNRPLPPSNFDEVREFARVKIGLGDTRFSASYNLVEKSDFYLNAGASLIVPTGSRGVLRDGRFKDPTELENNNAFDFLLVPPRELFLVPRLGHGGHFGLGALLSSRLSLFDCVDIRARVAYDYFFSAVESRFVMLKQRLPLQDASFFQFKHQYITPLMLDLHVKPGGIGTAMFGIDYYWGDFIFTAGYDYYLQQREDFDLLAEPECNRDFNSVDLKLPEAMQGQYEEHKVTGAIHYQHRDKILFGIGADWTWKANGTANDWTAFATISIPF